MTLLDRTLASTVASEYKDFPAHFFLYYHICR